ncbi:MAG: NADH-quinone oxidoreductase subunit [Thermoleophilaceae bacterium]|nr:NADH-quinone oxidoreductase subunit [Thermoleophilaceae bacterium]MEA2388162.1 NADH-quinone oxidoreductase subunit [Thermoleophilaceae bacterium]
MLLEQVLFFVAAAGAIGGALGVVLLRNPFFSVLALVAHLVALALLFLLLNAEFIAAAQLVVYAGAVMVLYVFVVAYIGGVEEPLGAGSASVAIGRLGPLFAGALLAELTIAVVGSGLDALDTRGARIEAGFGSPGAIGKLLLEKFLIPFEAASLLLMVAAVGAIVLARRRRGLHGVEEDELPERAGNAPIGYPGGRAGAGEGDDEGPPPGTAEGFGDPTPERDATPEPAA